MNLVSGSWNSGMQLDQPSACEQDGRAIAGNALVKSDKITEEEHAPPHRCAKEQHILYKHVQLTVIAAVCTV